MRDMKDGLGKLDRGPSMGLCQRLSELGTSFCLPCRSLSQFLHLLVVEILLCSSLTENLEIRLWFWGVFKSRRSPSSCVWCRADSMYVQLLSLSRSQTHETPGRRQLQRLPNIVGRCQIFSSFLISPPFFFGSSR